MLHMFEAGLMAVTVKLVLCVVICLQYSDASTDIQSKTYQHTLENGEKVICNKCSPGHYLIDYCFTNGGNSQCAPCDNGTYNSEYTRATSCARCDTECIQPKDREYIATNCTKVSNISCKCMEGYYREPYKFGLCLWIVPCPPGEGVVHEGHEWANTVCGVCPENHFSANSSKTERCQRCSSCPPETVQYQDCQPEADRVCGPPGADDLPIEALIGIGVGATFLVLVVITLVCCFCVMRERCAAIRKSVCRCCYRPYQECTQYDKSMKYTPAHTDDAGRTMSNGQVTPDLIQYTPNGHRDPRKIHEIPNGVAVENGTAGSHTARNTQSGEQSPGSLNTVFYQLREDLISQDYPQFFRFLFTGDADSHINEMKIDYQVHGVKEVIYRILAKWKDIEKENATTDKILAALKEWGRIDLFEKYSSIFGHSNVQMDTLEDRNSSRSSVTTEV